MSGALRLGGLLAGMVAFDVIMNFPGVSASSPVLSLLAPSIDLLVVLAILLSASYAAQGVRTGFAAGVALLVAVVVGWQAWRRWGAPPEAGRIVVLSLSTLCAGAASFFLSRLVLRGFGSAMLRNLFFLAAACGAVVQALLGVRVFSPSVVPVILGLR
ncbi:MAG TPA: hypothetical protein VMM82_05990 [Spirochaetia bacterium]|nr:hypothetical protein [Spirochaetia bacterium]